MKQKVIIFSLVAAGFVQLLPLARAQETDGSDLRRETDQRNLRFGKLSTEEQLKVRAAQTKAAEDPQVKEALRKRNEAVEAFRTAVRASMLKADPTLQPVLDRIKQ